jgi:hypothetical protein
MFIALNTIIMSPEYIGMFDGDPRIVELADRLIKEMEATDLFEDEVLSTFRQAVRTGLFADLDAALENLYDYADEADIDLGKSDGTPANQSN